MITFKSFISAIHDAIIQSCDSLRDKNAELLDKYFTEVKPSEGSSDKGSEHSGKLIPKTVILEYQNLGQDGTAVTNEVHVPLITLVPLSMPQIEKVTLTADFEMTVADGELRLEFANRSSAVVGIGGLFKKQDTQTGRLEIVMTPQETPAGMKLVMEAYEANLKQQL
jgi:hypothetical protein